MPRGASTHGALGRPTLPALLGALSGREADHPEQETPWVSRWGRGRWWQHRSLRNPQGVLSLLLNARSHVCKTDEAPSQSRCGGPLGGWASTQTSPVYEGKEEIKTQYVLSYALSLDEKDHIEFLPRVTLVFSDPGLAEVTVKNSFRFQTRFPLPEDSNTGDQGQPHCIPRVPPPTLPGLSRPSGGHLSHDAIRPFCRHLQGLPVCWSAVSGRAPGWGSIVTANLAPSDLAGNGTPATSTAQSQQGGTANASPKG
ncbi:unnamed protein product [Rangifer tarandus platyrhynchus]|uniref:Uncharacterized protein n=1 Tax=Rangifer tarandus platyrhynchus TaxID=3082113 RepID=A0AC59Z4I1_RANTA